MTEYVLSFGGGVNTAALLALAYRGDVRVDYAIFADTGCEIPETYEWIEQYAKPVCDELGIVFVTVKGRENVHGTEVTNLYDYLYQYRIIPTRIRRSCTEKFKIKPIREWIINNLSDPVVLLGIDASEKHRAVPGIDFECRYPLIEFGMTRNDCKRVIREVGWEVPPKSGCYICPFTSLSRFRWLLEAHPDLFMRAEELEKNNHKYPEFTIKQGVKLEDLRKKRTTCTKQMTLEGEFACVMCHL